MSVLLIPLLGGADILACPKPRGFGVKGLPFLLWWGRHSCLPSPISAILAGAVAKKPQPPAASGRPQSERGQRVLAVDPDAAFLTAVKRVVESGRCRVDCAATAAEAAAFLQRNRYNLVIADAAMPGLAPADLFGRLEEELGGGMRLLFLAAEPPTAALQAFLDERRLACLVKPLHLRRFLDKLDDLLLLAAQPPDEDD